VIVAEEVCAAGDEGHDLDAIVDEPVACALARSSWGS